MAAPLTEKNTNQPGKGDFQATIRALVLLQQERDSAHAAVRARFKKAKADGFDIAALQHVMEMRKQDPDVVAQQMNAKLRYLAWSGIAVGTQAELFDDRPTVDGLTDKERKEAALFEAEQAGYQTGRAGGKRVESNPHPAGTEEYDEFDKGWIRGQTHIAREMVPKDAPKPAKPGRKKKTGNPEDVPPAGGESGEAVH